MNPSTLEEITRSPAHWRGPALAATPERWIRRLDPAQLAALDRTVLRLEAEGWGDDDRDLATLEPGDAPLGPLDPLLHELRHELLDGLGVVLLRGLPVERYNSRQAAIAFWCLGRHIGDPVSQNAAGHALGHVRDLGFDYNKPTARGYQTSERLPYHCDSGDVVGLLSLRTARSGGQSSLVSSTALFLALAHEQPEVLDVLMQPTYRDRRDEIPEGRKPWYSMPVFTVHDGRVFGHYVRSAIRKAQRFAEVPRITTAQEQAFDCLDRLAADPAFCLDMDFKPGDVQLVCNHTVLHSRTRYEDWVEPERKRHLLRLWLACDDGPPLPPAYAEAQGLNEKGRPLGIHCPGVPLNAPLAATDGGAGESARRL